MNEVEKMYENAGIEPINFAKQGAIDFTNTMEIDGKRYPDFTAEKLLDIIIFLINRKQPLLFSLSEERENISRTILEKGLAEIVNKIWQELTEEEKQQIKNILESEVRE